MGRIGYFDAYSRRRLGQQDVFDNNLLGPLIDFLIQNTWMHERYGRHGGTCGCTVLLGLTLLTPVPVNARRSFQRPSLLPTPVASFQHPSLRSNARRSLSTPPIPLQHSLACDGSQQLNRTEAYFEYPATVGMLLREIRYAAAYSGRPVWVVSKGGNGVHDVGKGYKDRACVAAPAHDFSRPAATALTLT